MAKKVPSAKKAASKAKEKAFCTVSYAEPVRKYGTNLSPKEAKAKRQVTRAEKAGATVKTISYKRGNQTGDGSETVNISIARKVDVDASKKKTLKSSGKTFKATAMQMKSDRSRAASRAAAKRKKK